MAARRRARAFRRGPKNYVWSAVLIADQTVGSGAMAGQNIVQATDWAGAVGFERATLLTVRGWLNIVQVGTEVLQWFAVVAKQGADEPALDALVVATYVDEDLLWTGGGSFPATGVAQATNKDDREIHIKVKRKLSVDDNITLFVGATAGLLTFNTVLRGLVDKG